MAQETSLPIIFTMKGKDKVRTLKTYTETYLKEEILAESIVRNIPAFSRFLELAADQSGMSVNYNNFARETGRFSWPFKFNLSQSPVSLNPFSARR